MAGTYHGMSCKGLCRCVSRNIQARRKCTWIFPGKNHVNIALVSINTHTLLRWCWWDFVLLTPSWSLPMFSLKGCCKTVERLHLSSIVDAFEWLIREFQRLRISLMINRFKENILVNPKNDTVVAVAWDVLDLLKLVMRNKLFMKKIKRIDGTGDRAGVQVLDGVRGGRCHCTWLEVDTEACGTKLDTTKLTWARFAQSLSFYFCTLAWTSLAEVT